MADANRAKWAVRRAGPGDRVAWGSLFQAYGASAGDDVGESHLDRVWSWVMDPEAKTECLLLHLEDEAQPVGLAHYRPFERPLHGSVGCYLDDLFVDELARGRGGARALLEHLSALAATNGWTTVRWTTGEGNAAQTLYDTLATRSPVITFNMDPSSVRD
jgi:GNAT superfamily N-acetyltransferase